MFSVEVKTFETEVADPTHNAAHVLQTNVSLKIDPVLVRGVAILTIMSAAIGNWCCLFGGSKIG